MTVESTDKMAKDSSVALITGSGSGIGRATATMFARRGYRLVLVGRTESTLLETNRLIETATNSVETLVTPADISDAAQCTDLVEKVVDRFGRLDVLVNNAGVAPLVKIPEVDETLIRETFAINTFGPAMLTVASWPIFVRQKAGCVINVSTMGTDDPFPGFFAYAGSKAAVESFTRSIAKEGGPINIHGFCIAPGAVETPLLRTLFSTDQLPRDQTLDSSEVAAVIVACAVGERPEDPGRTIYLSKS